MWASGEKRSRNYYIRAIILILLILNSSLLYASNSYIINERIKNDIKKFVYLNYNTTNPYLVYDIFHEDVINRYLNCFVIKKYFNNQNDLKIDNIVIDIYSYIDDFKKIHLSGYVIVNDEQIDIDYDIIMKQYKDDPNNITTIKSPKIRKYRILYVVNNKDFEYCLIK